MVVIWSLRSSAPHAESRRAPNEGARSIPYKQCVPLCVKKVLRPQDTRYAPPYNFVYGCGSRPDTQLKMCTRLTYPVRKSCVTSNRTMDLLQKHNCTGKLAHARVIGPIRLNSPANMLPRTDAVPQFIHRWRCRLFLRTGPSPVWVRH